MKSLAIIILLAIFLANPLQAFIVKIEPLTTTITPGQEATYKLHINNDKNKEEVFSVTTRDPSWLAMTEPAIGRIPAKTTIHTTLTLKPKLGTTTGIQVVPVKIRADLSDEYKEETLTINLMPSAFGGQYEPTVSIGMDVPKEQDPRQIMPVLITLRNHNPRNISEATLVIDGQLFYKEEMINLDPDEEKQLKYNFPINTRQPPNTHKLVVQLVYQGQTVSETKKSYTIKAYQALEERFSSEKKTLQSQQTFTVQNNGNAPQTYEKNVHYQFYLKPFISAKPRPENAVIEGKKQWHWEQTLNPDQSYTLVITQDYRLLLYVLAGIIVIIIGYYSLRKPITVKKEAIPEGHENYAEVADFKIRILMINRSSRELRNLHVVDRIPSMARLIHKEHLGTLKPNKILTTEKKDSLLFWNIETLEPYEERIVTYHIQSKLKVYGGINLPRTKVKYESKGRERKTYSNYVYVFGKRK